MTKKIGFYHSAHSKHCIFSHKNYSFEDADIIAVLGGDGTMLNAIRDLIFLKKDFLGIQYGNIGFLMNQNKSLIDNIESCTRTILHPLEAIAELVDGSFCKQLAFNEVSILRCSPQAGHISVEIDNVVVLPMLICDGIIIATTIGSTGYNFSARGPILPIGSNLLAVTPVCPFRPRGLRGAILDYNSRIRVKVLDPEKRPMHICTDNNEMMLCRSVDIMYSVEISFALLSDPKEPIGHKALYEQFLV